MGEWIAKRKLPCDSWFETYDFCISFVLFCQLYDHGGFDTIQNCILSRFFFRRYSLYFIVEQKTMLFRMLSRLTFLGNEPLNFVRYIVQFWDLDDLKRLMDYPVAKQLVTFANLRQANRAFLPNMFARKRVIQLLEWIGTWCDSECQMLALCDVYAKNKLLVRDSPTNSDAWTWFRSFVNQRSLKVL